jgi:hypothetical protein
MISVSASNHRRIYRVLDQITLERRQSFNFAETIDFHSIVKADTAGK